MTSTNSTKGARVRAVAAELVDAVWGHTSVGPGSLSGLVNELRSALVHAAGNGLGAIRLVLSAGAHIPLGSVAAAAGRVSASSRAGTITRRLPSGVAPSGSSMMLLKGVAVTEQEYYEKGGETFLCRDGSGESIPTQLVNDDYW